MKGHAALGEVRLHRFRHLRIKRRQDLVEHLHNRYGDSASHQIFGHFETDETAANNDRAFDFMFLDP